MRGERTGLRDLVGQKSPVSEAYRSEGFALTGYDIPGCMEDGAWMPWENSSVVAVAAAVAHPGLEKLLQFHYGIGPSGVRGSIRLVFRSTDARILLFVPCRKKSNIKKTIKKKNKNSKNRHSIKIPYRIPVKIPHSYPLKGAVM